MEPATVLIASSADVMGLSSTVERWRIRVKLKMPTEEREGEELL